jgi:ribulose bisphosphate carboxylase small subunit
MELVQHGIPLSSLSSLDETESLIGQSLFGDWLLRIEHLGTEPQSSSNWKQWGDAFFAVKDTERVMQALVACHASNPNHSIRIYAEKIRPETRLIYSVYDAAEDQAAEKNAAKENLVASAANQDVGESLVARESQARSKGNSVWRYIAATGALAGSILLWESAAN